MWRILLFFMICASPLPEIASVATLYCRIQADGSCGVINITAVTQQNEAINVYGQSAGYTNILTKRIDFYYPNKLQYISTNIFTIFPSLTYFVMDNVGFNYLLPGALPANCGGLTSLQLTMGDFPVLLDGFAQQCTKIEFLYVMKNNIQSLDPNALRGLGSLRHFNAWENSITWIPPTFFQYTPNIESISIYYNKISAVDSNTFKNLPKLTNLVLTGNSLTCMPALQFATIPVNGFQFTFASNPITAMDKNLLIPIFSDPLKNPFVGLQYIACVGTSPCGILTKANYQNCTNGVFQTCYNNYATVMSTTGICGAIPPASIECQFGSNGLCAEYCTITKMSPIISHNQTITVYGKPLNYINFNAMNMVFMEPYAISYIPTQFFTIFPNTLSVFLNRVGLSNLVTDAFGSCGKVKQITINNENIPILNNGFAQQCLLVTYLNLNMNNIQVLDSNALKGLTNLQEIYFNDNSIACVPADFFQYTLKLTTIFMRRNRIAAIDRNTFKSLTFLRQVDLQSNSLTFLTSIIISNIPATGFKFDVSYNKINAMNSTFLGQFFTTYYKTPTIYLNGISCINDSNTCGTIGQTNYPICNTTQLKTCYDNFAAVGFSTVNICNAA